MRQDVVGFDIEYGPGHSTEAELASIQIYTPWDDRTHFFPINMGGVKNDPAPILNRLADRQFKVVGFNLYNDLLICSRYGPMPEPYFDGFLYFAQTPLALTADPKRRGLKDLCEDYHLGDISKYLRFEDVCPQEDMTKVDPRDPLVQQYCKNDPVLAYLLAQHLSTRFPQNLSSHSDEMAVLPHFVNMTKYGMRIDATKIPEMQRDLSARQAKLQNELAASLGFSFKANSSVDMERVFNTLGLEMPPPTPSGRPSFKEENLSTYLPNQIIEKILEVKGLIYSIPRIASVLNNHIVRGHLHPEYKQLSWTGSARVYTASPSTNSLPQEVRKHIIPEPGKKFIYFDWKQAEFIYGCQLAGELDVIQGYKEGIDVMRVTAAKNFGVPLDQVTDDQREIQKVVLYASMYGSEGISVSTALKCSRSSGESYVREFWDSLPHLKELSQSIIEKAHADGYTETLTGLKRFLPEIHSSVGRIRAESERKAFNTAMQSGVACLFKKGLIQLNGVLPRDCRVVTGVFDSFLVEVPESMNLEEFRPFAEIASHFDINGKLVEFRFDLSEGYSWNQAQKG